jgi:hypothetical protein
MFIILNIELALIKHVKIFKTALIKRIEKVFIIYKYLF